MVSLDDLIFSRV